MAIGAVNLVLVLILMFRKGPDTTPTVIHHTGGIVVGQLTTRSIAGKVTDLKVKPARHKLMPLIMDPALTLFRQADKGVNRLVRSDPFWVFWAILAGIAIIAIMLLQK
jgi:hypothetical protein